MGFSTGNVLEKGSTLWKEFECGICLNLVEYPVYTKCSHVFCKGCLSEWLVQKADCPQCKAPLTSNDDVRPLREQAPLAWRILSRVRVRCPLHAQQCEWKGDYGDLHDHLSNSKTHTINNLSSSSDKQALERASAEAFKEQGNQQFRARAYNQAIKMYSKAISLAPDMFHVLANRSAAYMQIERFDDALADARASIKLNPNYTKGHRRLSQALCEMGDFKSAASHLEEHLKRLPDLAGDHQKVLQLSQGMADGESAMKEGKYVEARAIFKAVGNLTKSAVTPTLMSLRAELEMGICDHALRRSLSIIRTRRKCTDAYVVRAWALYLSKDFDQALKHCREALRLDPDFGEARTLYKKVKAVFRAFENARDAFKKRDFTESARCFTEAIESADVSIHSPLWASLHAQRAQAYRRLKQWNECLHDCKTALHSQDDNKQAWITRASALIELNRPQEAEKEMKELLETTFQNDTMVRHMLDKAAFEVRKRKRPDYYELLGISRIASEPEIKMAYKKRALEIHPDRVAKEDDEAKTKEHEEKFKIIGEALEILTDPMKRELYDEGHDKQAIEERVQAAQRAAHNHQNGHHHH
mmetsp:Transcript_5502/g.8662  ORF Transcript_5502/g.8662 Transcript_5502/m.8662 type:complete len:586 (-) Transcript_5502:111-1868(-)